MSYWLSKHAEIFGLQVYTVCPDYLELLADTTTYGHLIRVHLVPPETLSKEDDVTITVTVAMDTISQLQYHGTSDNTLIECVGCTEVTSEEKVQNV